MEVQTKKCPKCGAEIKEGQTECEKCHEKLDVKQNLEQETKPEQKPAKPEKMTNALKRELGNQKLAEDKEARKISSSKLSLPQLIAFTVAMALVLVLIPLGALIYIIIRWVKTAGSVPALVLAILGFGIFISIGVYFTICMIKNILAMKKTMEQKKVEFVK